MKQRFLCLLKRDFRAFSEGVTSAADVSGELTLLVSYLNRDRFEQLQLQSNLGRPISYDGFCHICGVSSHDSMHFGFEYFHVSMAVEDLKSVLLLRYNLQSTVL